MAGLACAAELAGRADCVIFERLPVAGGEHWEDVAVSRLVAAARQGGARFATGTQTVRWNGDSVLALGQEGGEVEADAIVIATGHRPLTRAELGLAGPRCGGVLPVTVALHLLHHGVRLGQRPAVVGAGEQALDAARAILSGGAAAVTLLAPDGPPGADLPPGLDLHAGARPLRVEGEGRISAVEAESAGGERLRVECDALVLAHGRLPYRNVDGAVFEGPAVVYAQPGTDPPDGPATEAAGRAAARRALELDAAPVHFDYPPRIGGPT